MQTNPSTASEPSASPDGSPSGGVISTVGASTTTARARLTAIGPSGSRSASRRLTMNGAVAYPRVATSTSRAPRSSSVRPAMSTPSSAATPPNPITSPASRSPVGLSSGARRTDSSATISGMEAIRIAASDDETCSPAGMSRNGTATSQTV